MIKKNSIFKLAFSILQRDIIIFVLSILTGAMIARKLGPELLGVWVLLSLIPAYAEAFGRLKTDVASVYILGSKQHKPQEILFFNNLVALITSLSISLALLWQLDSIDQMLFDQSSSHKHELFLLICFIPFEFLLLNYSYYFVAEENISTYNKINLYKALLNSIFVYFLLFFYDFSLLGVVLSKVIPSLIILLFAWISVDRTGWKAFSLNFNKSLAKKVLGYSKNFYFTGLISHLFEFTTKTLGAVFLKNSDIAFYSQGESSSKLLNKIPEALAVILYPRISSLEEEDSKEISIKSFKVTLIILILLGSLLALVAKKIIVFLYGSVFETSADVLLVAIPGVVIGAACMTLKPFFEGRGQANLIPAIHIPPLILQLILGYYLIGSFGLIGAALTFSIGFLMLGSSFFITFVYFNSVPILEMLPRLVDLKFIYFTIIDFLRKKLNHSKN